MPETNGAKTQDRTDPKPRVDRLVPTYAIDRKLGGIHVGTPDSEIEVLIASAIDAAEKGPEGHLWTAKIRRQTMRYALWRHHRNLAEYAYVMRGPR